MADAQRLGGVTPKGERVATGILDAAIDVIADSGCVGASMQAIADRAEVDKRVLRYYFGDRDRLFAAVVARLGDRILGEAEEALADVVDPDAGFAIGFRVLWDTVVSTPRLHRAYFDLITTSLTDPELATHVVAIRERFGRLIEERAVAAEAAGWVWTMDRSAMNALVIAGLEGLTLDYLQRGATDQLDRALRAYEDWLQGLARRAKPG
ncbi:MAG TPA: TetR/AcrR family transcriptional regulator [Solirubrobacterales bacterium]|nr:TetR/AcrR family transcriptional regulator [Solirubrobacterales bacterium]